MPVDCNKPQNAQEQQLCSCKKATDSMATLINNYNKDLQTYKSNIDSRDRWLKQYNDWQNKTGNYSIWNERFNTVGTVLYNKLNWHTCNSLVNSDDANWQCGKMASDNSLYDPWDFYAKADYTMSGIGPCAWKGVACSRRSGSFRINNDYQSQKPSSDPLNSNKVWLNKTAPIPPAPLPSSNINCCSIIFSDIDVKSGNVNIQNVNQNCSQKISTKLSQSNSIQNTNSSPNSSQNEDMTQQIILVSVVVILVLLIMSSFTFILFKRK